MRMRALEVVCVGLVVATGCSDGTKSAVPGSAGGPAVAPADLGTAAMPPPMTMALLRVAHLTPDAAPIDVCVAVHGSTAYQGPLLKQAGVDAGGLAYAQATKYLALPPAQYDFRVVDGAAASCATGMLDVTSLPALRGGESVTVAALGLMHPPAGNNNTLQLKLYVDDTGAASGPVALRFIHASPDTPAVDAGIGSGNQFTPAFLNVGYAAVGLSVTSGANGYIMLGPESHAPLLTVRLRGGTDDALTFTPPSEPSFGDTVTAFLIGNLSSAPAPFKALVCVDNGAPTGALADCAVRP